MSYTHIIDVHTPKGDIEGECTLNGGSNPKFNITSPVTGEMKHDEKFHNVMRAVLELSQYAGGLEKFEIRIKE